MVNEIIDAKAKILIVDDNPKNLSVLGQLLRELNYSCEFAMSGVEALKWLKKDAFDLILLDVVMPIMDGYEVCDKIKSQELYSHIPIIFITIKNDLESTVKGFEKGAVDYINKPFNSKELSARISTQIELKKSRDQLKTNIATLVEKNNYIMESIHYAQYIQKHILPDIPSLNQYFSDHFLIYKPLQIVSGDFYWFKTIGNYILFAVVDCTGHGVPGALMSIAAYTALNQAVNENKYHKPGAIIQFAHEYLSSLFNNITNSNFQEGMDLTVCAIDTSNKTICISGAQQKAIIFQKNKLEVYSGDRVSVGEADCSGMGFREVVIPFDKGDTIYLQSDGIVDQFAFNDGKKFGTRQYIEMLQEINTKPMQEQSKLINNVFDTWKGDGVQIDDVTIWGIKY